MNAGSERHFRCLNLPDLIARGADSWEISRMPESADTPYFFRPRLVEVQRWAENVVWQHFGVRSRLQRRYGRVSWAHRARFRLEHRLVPALSRFRRHARSAVPAQPGARRAQARPMQAMGCALMLCCSNTSLLAMADPALAAGQLHALAERAARCGLRVGFEALTWGRPTARYGQAWDLVRRAEWLPGSFRRQRVSAAGAVRTEPDLSKFFCFGTPMPDAPRAVTKLH